MDDKLIQFFNGRICQCCATNNVEIKKWYLCKTCYARLYRRLQIDLNDEIWGENLKFNINELEKLTKKTFRYGYFYLYLIASGKEFIEDFDEIHKNKATFQQRFCVIDKTGKMVTSKHPLFLEAAYLVKKKEYEESVLKEAGKEAPHVHAN